MNELEVLNMYENIHCQFVLQSRILVYVIERSGEPLAGEGDGW